MNIHWHLQDRGLHSSATQCHLAVQMEVWLVSQKLLDIDLKINSPVLYGSSFGEGEPEGGTNCQYIGNRDRLLAAEPHIDESVRPEAGGNLRFQLGARADAELN